MSAREWWGLLAMAVIVASCAGFVLGRLARGRLLDEVHDTGYSMGWDDAGEQSLPAETAIELVSLPPIRELSPAALEAASELPLGGTLREGMSGQPLLQEPAGGASPSDALPVPPLTDGGPWLEERQARPSAYAGHQTPAQRRRDKHKQRGQYAPESEPGDDTLTFMFGEFGSWEEQLAAIGREGQTPWLTAQLQEVA